MRIRTENGAVGGLHGGAWRSAGPLAVGAREVVLVARRANALGGRARRKRIRVEVEELERQLREQVAAVDRRKAVLAASNCSESVMGEFPEFAEMGTGSPV